MSHNHNFVYSAEASKPGMFVTVCAGCGEVNVTELKKAPPLVPTEIPGVYDIPSRLPSNPPPFSPRPYPNPFELPGGFRKLID